MSVHWGVGGGGGSGGGSAVTEDRVGRLRPSRCIDSSDRSAPTHYETIPLAGPLPLSLSSPLCNLRWDSLSLFLSLLVFTLIFSLSRPTAADQTHGDRGRDPEAEEQGKGGGGRCVFLRVAWTGGSVVTGGWAVGEGGEWLLVV